MEIKGIKFDDNITAFLDKHCNDDIEKLHMIDGMITNYNGVKIILETEANKFYSKKDEYIKNKFNGVLKKYILYPVLVFSGICSVLVSVISSKIIIFIILCMLIIQFVVLRLVIPEINNLSVNYFKLKYNEYFDSIDEIDKVLISLCQIRSSVEKRISENKKTMGNNISLSKTIESEKNIEVNKPYCRVRKI